MNSAAYILDPAPELAQHTQLETHLPLTGVLLSVVTILCTHSPYRRQRAPSLLAAEPGTLPLRPHWDNSKLHLIQLYVLKNLKATCNNVRLVGICLSA